MKDSKQLLSALICRLCEGRDMHYNPIYLYGEKSDTENTVNQILAAMQAAHTCERIRETDGTAFADSLTDAMISGTYNDFLNVYLHDSVLVFRNIDIIAGRPCTEQTFFYLFDRFYESNRRIIITGTVEPGKIRKLADRVRTQLLGGLVLEV